MKAPSVKPVRCAIYTRVSTDHGLDQEFNSLDAQYDAASAYIKTASAAGFCARTRPPGTEFLDAETGRQKSSTNARTPTETKIQELSTRKSAQKRPTTKESAISIRAT